MTMKLNEVIQEKPEIMLQKLDRPLVFNNITLADQAWLDNRYSQEELTKVFTEMKTNEILEIAVRFLDDRSKEYLSKIKIVERDEYGVEKEAVKFTLAQKLFNICGEGEFAMLIKKIFEIRSNSVKQINKMFDVFEKKTEVETEPQAKKNKAKAGK